MAQTPHNRVHLFRLQILIIDGGLHVLRNIIDQKLTVHGITLSACLNNEKASITHLKRRGVITQAQYDILFPTGGQAPTTSEMDFTLIVCLLRCLKCFGLNKKFDWNTKPIATDVTIEADIYRLKAYRNKICYLTKTTEIQSNEFLFWWNDIEQILVRLSSPALNIKQIITDYKTCPLDSAEEKRLQEEVKMWKDYEADVDRLKEEMKKVHTGVTGVKKEVEAKFTGVEKKRQDAEKSNEGVSPTHTEEGKYQTRKKDDAVKKTGKKIAQNPDNRVYLFRLQILIIDGGLLVLRNIIDQNLTAQGITLSTCLNNEKATIARLKGRGIITHVQYDILFPTGGKVPTTSDMDFMLIICLLRNLKCFGLNKKFDWNTKPIATDVSVEADICRLKAYQNEICHLTTTTGIQPNDFVSWWNDIERILVRLSSPALNIKQIIADFKTCSLDPAEEKRLQEEVKMWKDYDANAVDRLKEEVKKVQTDVIGVKKEIEAEFTRVEKKLDAIEKRQDAEKSNEGVSLIQTEEGKYQTRKKESWDRCIERESESDANFLLEREILPSNSELNTACHVFGRNSKVVSRICSTISQHVRKRLINVIDVWPSYKEDHKSIIFIVILKETYTFSVFKDYEYCIRCGNDVSTEGDLVAEYETKDRTMYQFDNEILEKLRKSINDNADDLLKRHSNINVILPSLIKSVGYKTGQHDIKHEPCIAIYVAVKGFIPLNETPFQKNINDFPTDVLEGVFEPFMRGPNDYHEHLKIGLAIHANVLNGDGILGGTLGGFIDHSMHGLCGLTCAHVVYNAAELMEIKDKKQCSLRKAVYQPIGERSSAFGEVVHAVYDNGSPCSSGVEVALIGIHNRQPNSGRFPETLNDFEAGFDAINPLCFHSGAVCETSEIRRRTEVYKFGMSSEITRGSFALQGAVVRKSQMQGQCHGFGYILMNQMVVLKIGDKPFAEPGDSGALALIEGGQDSIAIGIVEGGMNGRVFVTPICDILRAVGCTELKMHRFTGTDSVEEMEIG